MTHSLTLFFIVEPPSYQYMACYLAASIRQHFPSDVELVGYCPANRMGEVDPAAIETLRRMRCEVRPFETEGKFNPAYPHGNKLLACLEPRETDYSGFVDSDVLFIRDNAVENLVQPGHVSASVAASMYWAPQTVWKKIYAGLGMTVPKERVMLMRDKRKPMVPYYSSGFVLFPEGKLEGLDQTFPEVWMETAQSIDAIEDLDNKRPYLDQMSLPLAIKRAGLNWNELVEEQHFILGGSLRGQPFPKDRKIYTVHYRKWDVLKENELSEHGYKALRRQTGTRRVSKIWGCELPEGIAPAPSAKEQTPVKPKTAGPDPSKADIAAVTMVHEDHFFLDRWVRYYEGQIGRQNIYILRHGEDAEIDRIAKGCNIVHLPNPDDKSGFDRRRWTGLSRFASGLTLYYNWVICNDVDEIIAVDPDAGDTLSGYLNKAFESGKPPAVISPFAVEIVHTPKTEKDPITDDTPILSVRRNFRLNSNYSKPCITRGRIGFSVGQHGSNQKNVTLDPHLYLFHLRYVDDTLSRERLLRRQAWIEEKNGSIKDTKRKKSTWDQGEEGFDILSNQEPVEETIDFPDFRKKMIEGRSQAASTGNWFFRNMRSKELYRLPPRFAKLF